MTNTRRLKSSDFNFFGGRKKKPLLESFKLYDAKVGPFSLHRKFPLSLPYIRTSPLEIFSIRRCGVYSIQILFFLCVQILLEQLNEESKDAIIEVADSPLNKIICYAVALLCSVVLLLSTDSLFCGYLVFLSVFFFAIDLVSAQLSTHVAEYQEEEEEEEEEEAEMAMV